MMDYFDVEIEGYPLATFEEVDAAGNSRFTDVYGATVPGPTPPCPYLTRSWNTIRRPWMEPLPTQAGEPKQITIRSMMSELGVTMADSILTSLEAASVQIPVLKRVLFLLEPAQGGIDIHDPESVAMIETLTIAGVLTAAQYAALKGM